MIRVFHCSPLNTYFWPISPYSVRLKRARGYNGSANKLFLQIHTGTQASPSDVDITIPANATVPLESFVLLPNSEFLFDRAIDCLNDLVGPVVAVLSTTEATLTAATTEATTDVWLDLEEFAKALDSSWTTTQNTNASAQNQIWATIAAGTNKNALFEVVLNNNSGATAFFKIFAQGGTGIADGTVADAVFQVPANTVAPFQRIEFGLPNGAGFTPFHEVQAAGAQTDYYGCTFTLESVIGIINVDNQTVAKGANQLTGWKYQVKYSAVNT